jgi:hypothetical protein
MSACFGFIRRFPVKGCNISFILKILSDKHSIDTLLCTAQRQEAASNHAAAVSDPASPRVNEAFIDEKHVAGCLHPMQKEHRYSAIPAVALALCARSWTVVTVLLCSTTK